MSVLVQTHSCSVGFPDNDFARNGSNMFAAAADGNFFFATGRSLTKCQSPKVTQRSKRSGSLDASKPKNYQDVKHMEPSNAESPCLFRTALNNSKGLNSPRMSPKISQQISQLVAVNGLIQDTTKLNLKTDDQSLKVSPSGIAAKQENRVFRSMSPTELAGRIQQSPSILLLLDCRSFISFNMAHISEALSVCCSNRLAMKRLQCGKLKLADIVSGCEGKAEYSKKKGKSTVVVYDDSTSDLETLTAANPLRLILGTLQKEGEEAFFVKGGLKAFQKCHSDLCATPDVQEAPKLLYSPTTPILDDQIDTAVAAQILPFLYVGNERDAANLDRLRDLGITHVLNVTSHIPFHFESEGLVCKRLPASDSGAQNLKQYFQDAYNFIDEVRQAGGKVLVHCQAGVSRSATISIAYVMKRTTLSMVDAFRYVKTRRSIIAPNFNFMGQLYELEQHLNDGLVARQLEPSLALLPAEE